MLRFLSSIYQVGVGCLGAEKEDRNMPEMVLFVSLNGDFLQSVCSY